MSVETRQNKQASLQERGDLSDLFASALVLIRGNKRSELQRQNLRNALQLFQENRLATVLAGSTTSELPKDILALLSQPIKSALPRITIGPDLGEYGVRYVGELLPLHRRAWKLKADTKYGSVIRMLLVDWGIPFDLDLNAIRWIPPYAEDPVILSMWNMRKHELRPERTCNQAEGCESVGEFIRTLAGLHVRAWRHPSRYHYIEKIKELGLRPTMWIPSSWTPPVRTPDACAAHVAVPVQEV